MKILNCYQMVSILHLVLIKYRLLTVLILPSKYCVKNLSALWYRSRLSAKILVSCLWHFKSSSLNCEGYRRWVKSRWRRQTILAKDQVFLQKLEHRSSCCFLELAVFMITFRRKQCDGQCHQYSLSPYFWKSSFPASLM